MTARDFSSKFVQQHMYKFLNLVTLTAILMWPVSLVFASFGHLIIASLFAVVSFIATAILAEIALKVFKVLKDPFGSMQDTISDLSEHGFELDLNEAFALMETLLKQPKEDLPEFGAGGGPDA